MLIVQIVFPWSVNLFHCNTKNNSGGGGKLVLQLMSSIIKTRPVCRLYHNVLEFSLGRWHNCSHNSPFPFLLLTFLRNNDIWGGGGGATTNLNGGIGWRRCWVAAVALGGGMTKKVWWNKTNMLCYLNYDVGWGGRLSGRPNCSRRFPSVRFLF